MSILSSSRLLKKSWVLFLLLQSGRAAETLTVTDPLSPAISGVAALVEGALGDAAVNQTLAGLGGSLATLLRAALAQPALAIEAIPGLLPAAVTSIWTLLGGLLKEAAKPPVVVLGDAKLALVKAAAGVLLNPIALKLDTLEALVEKAATPFCRAAQFTPAAKLPATMTYAKMTLTLETGACGLVGAAKADPKHPGSLVATENFVCQTPSLKWAKTPAVYTPAHTSPAALTAASCRLAVNTTDFWTRTLFSAGPPIVYKSMDALRAAAAAGVQPGPAPPSQLGAWLAQAQQQISDIVAEQVPPPPYNLDALLAKLTLPGTG
ncbi:hypothetical protein WJX81_003361 [Elliptochloris bilobata]|uniref:Uncharacterized protein n=1 Tax=Elliptochloris bilobata TaxID=381761 RepID=A0AAW1SJH3_9CHLO